MQNGVKSIEWMPEFGWIFIGICMFGVSDYLARTFCKTNNDCLIYYILLGIIGIIIVHNNSIYWEDFYQSQYKKYHSKNNKKRQK